MVGRRIIKLLPYLTWSIYYMGLSPKHLRLNSVQQQLIQTWLKHHAILTALLDEAKQELRRRRWWVWDLKLRRCQFRHFFRQRASLEPDLNLAIAFRFLTSGVSYQDLTLAFWVPHNNTSLFVQEVCNAIVQEYNAGVWETSSTEDTWREVAQQFQDKWNFPHCLDGKQTALSFPPVIPWSLPSGGAMMSLCGLGISLNEYCVRVKKLTRQ